MEFFKFTKKNSTVLFILFVVIFIIYGQSLSGDFVFDDRGINEHLGLLQKIENVPKVAMSPYWETANGLYRPVTLLSYSANLLIFGQDPFSFHLINLLLYLAICFFIYLLIKKLFQDSILAFISALLFLVLPIHTEVVANITGRSELLCLFFALLAILEFTKEKINHYLLFFYILLSIGSKETGIVILPTLALLFYQKHQSIGVDLAKKYFREISAVILATLSYFTLRFLVLGTPKFLNIKTSLIENPLLFTDTFSRIGTALKILFMYFYKTFWPANLCYDYSFNQIEIVRSWLNLGALAGLLVLLGATYLLFKYFKKYSLLSLGSCIFIFAYLPVSNIFFPIGTVAGERLFFFPSLGISLIVSFLIYKIINKIKEDKSKIIFMSVFVVAMMIYGLLALQRQSVWLTEENLFLSGESCAPNSVLARSNLGAMYLLKGDYVKAEKELKTSMGIKPIYSKGLNNLGLVYFKQGKYNLARDFYLKALSQEFPYSGALENMVLLYLKQGKYDLAKHWMRLTYGFTDQETDSIIENYKKQNE